MNLRTSNTLSLARLALVAVAGGLLGCSDGGGLGQRLEDKAPEKLRGVSVNYDVAGLGAEDPLPPSAPPPPTYPQGKPVKVLVWWQTADGVVHQKEVETRGGTISPEKYAGSLWVEVTPIGVKPKRLTTMPSTTPVLQH